MDIVLSGVAAPVEELSMFWGLIAASILIA
jgi:hypothetical protein